VERFFQKKHSTGASGDTLVIQVSSLPMGSPLLYGVLKREGRG